MLETGEGNKDSSIALTIQCEFKNGIDNNKNN